MKKLFFAVSVVAGLTAMGLTGCYYDKAEEVYPAGNGTNCDTTNISYSATISPIIGSSCATSGCHSGSAPAGGYNFTTHAGLMLAVNNNRLLGAIHHQAGFSPMPKGLPKLPACELQKITSWVNQGAPNN